MTNNDLAWAIYQALKEKGAIIGTVSVGIIERELDRAEAKRWIPVAERLPEAQVDVLVKGGGRYEIANYAPYCATPSWPYEWFTAGKALIMDVTHWQPLPEGPEAE